MAPPAFNGELETDMPEELDLDSFVYAQDEEIAAGIAAEPGEPYDGFVEAEDEVEEEPSEEPETEEGEGEDDETEEELEEPELDEEEPPARTGDREKDGVAHAAYKERQRRKEAEAREAKMAQELAYIRGQLQAGYELTAQQQAALQQAKPEEPLPEFEWGDLEGSFDSRYKTHRSREIALDREQAAKRAKEEWTAAVRASAKEARAEHPDYDEVEKRFVARASTPEGAHLNTLLHRQPDPAAWVYKVQKQFEARATRKNPEVEALEKKVEQLQRKLNGGKPPPKRSLSNARSAKPRRRGTTGPKSQEAAFDSVFDKKAR